MPRKKKEKETEETEDEEEVKEEKDESEDEEEESSDDAEKEKGNEENEEGSNIWLGVLIIGLIVFIGVYFLNNKITGNVIGGGSGLTIGVLLPLSGDAASYGLSVQKGIEMAKDDFSSYEFNFIYEDSRCDGKDAVTAINKLISVDKVDVIIGELCSGATLAVAPIAEENKVVLISPASTSPAVSNVGDYVFRTIPSDALQGGFGAKLVSDRGHSKLAIIYSNEDYGVGFSDVLIDKFEGEVVATESFERGATDVRAQITKIKEAKPDAIYVISNSPDSAVAVLRQIRQLGVRVEVFGSEGLKSEDIIKSAGASANGLILTSVSSGTTSFVQEHKETYNESPGPFAAQAYDAVQAIALGVQKGAKSSERLKEELYNLDFHGVSGKIKFDDKGDISGSYEVYEVLNGRFVPLVV